MTMMNVIPKDQAQIGDRVRWSWGGNLSYGRITRINRKTFNVDGEKDPEKRYRVSKDIVFEVLR